MPGVDLVLPDFAYLREAPGGIDAVVLTHGHEDHIGALPYVMREIGVREVWGTRLTLGMVKSKLDEHGLLRDAEFIEIDTSGDPIAVRARSRPSSHASRTPCPTPSRSRCTPTTARSCTRATTRSTTRRSTAAPPTSRKLARLGADGVDLMLADSTNAERPGITQSEQLVAAALKRIIRDAPGRVIVTSFSSHIHRLQGVIDASEACGRRVAVVGRSMIKNLNIARNLGYADVEEGTLIKPSELDELPDDEITVLCTGSQGEPMSALTRMAYSDHRQVQIQQGDTVIMSAKPVPGNELAVHDTMNALCRARRARAAPGQRGRARLGPRLRRGAQDDAGARAPAGVHAGARRAAHARRARDPGRVRRRRVATASTSATTATCSCSSAAPCAARAPSRPASCSSTASASAIPKDAVLRDRRQLSADGTLIIVCQLHRGPSRVEPEVIARGFAPEGADAADELLDEVRAHASSILDRLDADGVREHKLLQSHLHDELAELVWNRARKRPLVLPVVVDV